VFEYFLLQLVSFLNTQIIADQILDERIQVLQKRTIKTIYNIKIIVQIQITVIVHQNKSLALNLKADSSGINLRKRTSVHILFIWSWFRN
jgi:hypothetical protein